MHPVNEFLHRVVGPVSVGIELAGVAAIVLGAVLTTGRYLVQLRLPDRHVAYTRYRLGLARSIILGLELLVAADIIRTVVAPSYANVGLLAIIVAIRTFLSFSLEMEVTGRWPWHRDHAGDGEEDRRV